MRTLPKRTRLPRKTKKHLTSETNAISASADPKAEAKRRWPTVRNAKWFNPVVTKLRQLAGKGGRCMYCSGSEATDVEHYRPVAAFPKESMNWENYLWSCTACNRKKLARFPPVTEPGDMIINPLTENVWTFFFIDQFGLLTPNWDSTINGLNARAVSTRDILGLNREAVNDCRLARLRSLRTCASDTIKLFKNGTLSRKQVERRIALWLREPFQPDVANYFLVGPGSSTTPFSTLLAIVP
jgi:uncharacterized protein (TIGR02646 family)